MTTTFDLEVSMRVLNSSIEEMCFTGMVLSFVLLTGTDFKIFVIAEGLKIFLIGAAGVPCAARAELLKQSVSHNKAVSKSIESHFPGTDLTREQNVSHHFPHHFSSPGCWLCFLRLREEVHDHGRRMHLIIGTLVQLLTLNEKGKSIKSK